MTITLLFTSLAATLDYAGGKGANLARLTRAGFLVPNGFILSTSAYHAFVTGNVLTDRIQASLTELVADDASALESASQAIRAAFSSGRMPPEIKTPIVEAYAKIQFETETRDPLPSAHLRLRRTCSIYRLRASRIHTSTL